MPKNLFNMTGIKPINRKLQRLKARMPEEAVKAMRTEGAEPILRRAKELAPVKTGRLRDSGRIETTKSVSGTSIDVRFDTPYSLKVHETHPTHPRFLTRSLQEHAPHITKRMARKLSQTLRKIVRR